MWASIFLLSLAAGSDCNSSRNGEGGTGNAGDLLNPECNFGGICWLEKCECCKFDQSDYCDDYDLGIEYELGDFDGKNCQYVTYWISAEFGYNIQGDGVSCPDESEAAVPNLLNETSRYLADHGFNAVILSRDCQICSVGIPCVFDKKPDSTEGILVKFGVDLNTYYDKDCRTQSGDLPQSITPCAANGDYGRSAYSALLRVLDVDNSYANSLANIPSALGLGSGELSGTSMSRIYHGITTVRANIVRDQRPPTPAPTTAPTDKPTHYPTMTPPPTLNPTETPTLNPTETPTLNPTEIPTPPVTTRSLLPCDDYVQKQRISDSTVVLEFIATGSSCRGGINETWPGGRTCQSPYIICLPEENTPAMAPWNKTYESTTHRYTVADCKRECVYDQRCSGIEFSAETNSILGTCTLIDDAPVIVTDPKYDFDYVTNMTNFDTDSDVLCFEKPTEGARKSCNPYFEASDLSDVMLNCYCPNNRKGSYTKKVQRTAEYTRFCGEDENVDERIKRAQANRMFHLCENWCLFETSNPLRESWYYDPWKQCYRETYSGVGAHRSYCDRVVRNPDTIELQYVNGRTANLRECQRITSSPTEAPVEDINTTWSLSGMGESCDEACDLLNKSCAADQTATVFESEADLINAFSEAGFTCTSNNIVMDRKILEGYALPGLLHSRICANRQPTLRHLQDLDSDCHRILGADSKRLCACY